LTYPDLFIKQKVSYHGTTAAAKNCFSNRYSKHVTQKTINLDTEFMEPVLTGSKGQIHLIESLAQVACNDF
jgi:hypothetical protein